MAFYRVAPGQPVADVIADIMATWAVGEPITTTGVTHTGLTLGAVFDWTTIAEALTALAEMVNGQWDVVPVAGGGDLRFEARGTATLSSIVIHETGLVRMVKEQSDRQRLTTVQTVIGASPSGGTRTDEFQTDGVTREWPLTYPVDRVTEIALDGVSQDFSWLRRRVADRHRALGRRATQHADARPPAQELIVLYNWNFPLVITREIRRRASSPGGASIGSSRMPASTPSRPSRPAARRCSRATITRRPSTRRRSSPFWRGRSRASSPRCGCRRSASGASGGSSTARRSGGAGTSLIWSRGDRGA